MASPSICNVAGCNKPVHVQARGLCRAHYLRWHRSGDPIAGGKMQAATGEALAYIERVVLSHDGDDCLLWPFSRSRGAAMIYVDGRNSRVGRIVCERVHGAPPTPAHHAAHSCGKDHLGCVNPNHLRWATPSENNQDKLDHGTGNRGERHNLAKLSERDVLEIRHLRGSASQSSIARRFGVSVSTVKDIHARRTWGWLR